VYLLFLLLVPPTTTFGVHIGTAFGIGTVGLRFQAFSLLPMWGLVCCLAMNRSLRQTNETHVG
jgi:hypothetical protein